MRVGFCEKVSAKTTGIPALWSPRSLDHGRHREVACSECFDCRFIFLSVNKLAQGLPTPHPLPLSSKCGTPIVLLSLLASEAMPSNSKLNGLEAWMHNNGIVWNPSTVTLCGGINGEVDFAVAAARAVAEHDTLCQIPKEAVLSVRNSAIADLIEEEQLGGGLGLILCIMYEVSIGARSKW